MRLAEAKEHAKELVFIFIMEGVIRRVQLCAVGSWNVFGQNENYTPHFPCDFILENILYNKRMKNKFCVVLILADM